MSKSSLQQSALASCIERIHGRLSQGVEQSDDVIRQEASRSKLSLSTVEAMLRLDKRFIQSTVGWKVQSLTDRWSELALALPQLPSPASDAHSLFRQVVVELNAATRTHFDEYYPAEFTDGLQHRIAQLIAPYSADNVAYCKGPLFDLVMSELFDDAKRNRFFIPRTIPAMAATWAQPKPGDKVIDPCYGSGGFLLAMAQQAEHSLSQAGTVVQDHSTLFETSFTYVMNLGQSDQKINRSVLNKMLYGMDVDPAAAWAGRTNVALHGFGGANLQQANALDLRQSPFQLESFHIVAGNPSFGDKVTDPAILEQFQLGRDSKGRLLNQQYSDILFIEAFLRYAKPGGKVVILAPDGTLTNTSGQIVRDFIVRQALVEAVIGLPRRVFRNDAKSNILFLRKKASPSDRQQTPVFLATVENILTELPDALQRLLAGPEKR